MKKRTLQEWCDFTGMYGTQSSAGTTILHEVMPIQTSGDHIKIIWESKGGYVAIPRELIQGEVNIKTIYMPKG